MTNRNRKRQYKDSAMIASGSLIAIIVIVIFLLVLSPFI